MNKNTSFIPDILKNSILSGPDNRSTFVLKEKNAKYIANNKNHKTAISIQIDGSLIKSTDSKKCDKGLCIEDKRIFLIELKGVDFNTACEQLLVTYTTLSPLILDFKYKCRAVVREMPAKNNYPYSYRLLLSKLPKEKDSFKSASGVLEENI